MFIIVIVYVLSGVMLCYLNYSSFLIVCTKISLSFILLLLLLMFVSIADAFTFGFLETYPNCPFLIL